MRIFTQHGRRLLLVAAAALCLASAAFADGGDGVKAAVSSGPLGLHPNAIGLRFGGGSMFGAEVNYQMAMGSANRLELGLRWDTYSRNYGSFLFSAKQSYNYLGAVGFYQWHWNVSPTALDGGLNWYVGPGAMVGFWNVGPVTYLGTEIAEGSSGLYIKAGGQVGIEYDFNKNKCPLLTSIDARPLVNFLDGVSFGVDVAWALRYTF
jgi:hypothetical protein